MIDPAVPRLTLRLFGPWEACARGRPLPRLRTRKGEGILSLLALRGGAAVERGWLAGTLWPESSDDRARNNLRCTLVDLRHALGPEAGRLRAPTPRTLALDLTAAEVDVVAFDAAIARGDPASLEQAVALYRAPLLEEWSEPWALEERQRREEAYLAALEALAAHARSAGDLTTAERCLRRVLAADPWRESVQRALMRTLADQGSYAAAVLAFRELRLRLHREINAAPDAETTALFQQLRAEARQRAGARRPPAQMPAVGEIASHPHNLPAPPTALVGRRREVKTALALLRRPDERLLTLTGPPGSGKTRLGLQIAADLLADFPQGVYFVALAPISNPDLVASAIAQPLGVRNRRAAA